MVELIALLRLIRPNANHAITRGRGPSTAKVYTVALFLCGSQKEERHFIRLPSQAAFGSQHAVSHIGSKLSYRFVQLVRNFI